MFPSSAIPDRRPFAPSALPEFIARMGASDYRSPPPSFSLLRLVRRRAPTASADDRISLVTTHSRCKARRGLRSRGGPSRLPMRARSCCLLVRRDHRPTHQCKHFGTQLPSGAALPVPFAPRLLSRLRIKHPVTGMPARLNTRPVASGYLGGIRTRQTARHCQAATSGCFRLEHSPGGIHTHWKAPPYHGAHPEADFRSRVEQSFAGYA